MGDERNRIAKVPLFIEEIRRQMKERPEKSSAPRRQKRTKKKSRGTT